MRKNLSFLLGLICISIITKSQSTNPTVVASAGGLDRTSIFSLEWTMGEYAVESITAAGKMFTQGFHQPLLISSSVVKNKPNGTMYDISISPNPLLSVINFSITSSKNMKVFVTISEVAGVVSIQRNISSNTGTVPINMTHLAPGTYFLTVRSGVSSHIIKTYKIIKAQ